MDLRKLVKRYGGNYYKHKKGFIYQLSTKKELRRVATELLSVPDEVGKGELTKKQYGSVSKRFAPLLDWLGLW